MLEILISSSVLILVLALLRLVLRDKISARLQYALWLLVLVRLLVPVSFFRSPVSVAELTAPAVTRVEALSDTAVRYASLYAGTDTLAEPDTVGTFEKAEAIPTLTLRALAQNIRYAGMVVMAAWFILVNLRLARRLKKTRTPYEYNSAMPVYVAADIPSPCLFGLFKPAIYLTERAAEDAAQARQIIAHELTHFRHGDMIWALLRSMCLAIWWFDPFVWLAAALSRRDGELACDEGTIKALGEDARFDYGRTLVGMAKVGARPSDLLCGATTMTAGKKSLKERVARIASTPKKSVTFAVVVLLIAALAVGCTFSGSVSAKNGADAPEPTPTPQLWEGESVAEASTSDADEFILYFSEYLSEGVGAEDFDTWAAYIYFAGENDLQLSRDNYIPIFRGEIVAYERLSDGLAAFLVSYLDSEDTPVSECLHFVGRYDGRLYVFRNKASLPEELCSALEKLTLPDPFEDDPDIMIPDASYWEEVEWELAPFARSDRIETSYTPGFEPDLPEDDIFGPLTLEDYVYGTDSWQFTYNGEPIANDPFAVIKVLDDNDRTLWIMDDADALMIEEADGSITWVDYAGDPVDCADMIRHLLPWARGEEFGEPPAEMEAALAEAVAALGSFAPAELDPVNAEAGYAYPFWADLYDPKNPTGPYAVLYFGTDEMSADLRYERLYGNDDPTRSLGSAAYDMCRNFFAAAETVTDVKAGAWDGFITDGSIYYGPRLVWYDADNDLLFSLIAYHCNGGQPVGSYATDELIALAESVTAQ